MKKKDIGHGQEGLELIAHHVGYQLDAASVRGTETSLLREVGYYKKLADLRGQWREALSTGDGQKIIALLREREALRQERREITAPLAPTRKEIWEGRTFLEKVAFPEVLRRAGMEPIRHL